MAPAEVLRELSGLAAKLDVDLRFDRETPGVDLRRGGLCRLHGRATIVVDESLPMLEKIDIVATALATFDLERVYMAPEVRAELERRRVT